MKYEIKPTTKFQKDLKRIVKRGYKIELLTTVIQKLADGRMLDEKYKDHDLIGDYVGCRECHIQSDLVCTYF